MALNNFFSPFEILGANQIKWLYMEKNYFKIAIFVKKIMGLIML